MDKSDCSIIRENGRICNEKYAGRKVYYQTLGCKVNSYETDGIRKGFEEKGFISTLNFFDADVVVINTCTVTAEADRKSRQMIRRARRLSPGAIIAVMGCHVQMKGNICGADTYVGTGNRETLVQQVLDRLEENGSMQSIIEKERSPEHKKMGIGPLPRDKSVYQEFGSVISREGTRAFIKIQDGCDNFCSYCIIPYARGRARSRDPDAIIREATLLGEAGYHEIVISGINLCAYGIDLPDTMSGLSELLLRLNSISSIHRIRLGSLEPHMLNSQFILHLKETSKLCPHFHLSLQSGADSVLVRMRRHYTAKEYSRAVERLREAFPGMSLTTDVIAGFPGETDDEHALSLSFCQGMQFAKIHVFPFSTRSGTAAEKMIPKVEKAAISARCADYFRLSQILHNRYADSFVGRMVEVLFEEDTVDGYAVGYTKEYMRVRVPAKEGVFPGKEETVLIEGTMGEMLLGNVL